MLGSGSGGWLGLGGMFRRFGGIDGRIGMAGQIIGTGGSRALSDGIDDGCAGADRSRYLSSWAGPCRKSFEKRAKKQKTPREGLNPPISQRRTGCF